MVTPGVSRQASLACPRLGPVDPVAKGRRDDRPRQAIEQQFGVTRDLRSGHRELHVGKETLVAAIDDVLLGLLVRHGRGGADDVETELGGGAGELGCRHGRIVPAIATPRACVVE